MLDKELGLCEYEESEGCGKGCLHCDKNDCLICKEDYTKLLLYKKCTHKNNNTIDPLWRISACKIMDIRNENPKCYECFKGYV